MAAWEFVFQLHYGCNIDEQQTVLRKLNTLKLPPVAIYYSNSSGGYFGLRFVESLAEDTTLFQAQLRQAELRDELLEFFPGKRVQVFDTSPTKRD